MSLVRRLAALGLTLVAALSLSAQSTVPALRQTLPDRTLSTDAGSQTVDLRTYFYIPGVSGTVAQFTTDLGKFNVELYGNDAPLTVANFLSYLNAGAYANTIIHRSVALSVDTSVTPARRYNGIIQGGGYTYETLPNPVIRKDPIKLEYKLPNARGTIAMARAGDQISATSEWFINQDNNTDALAAANGGGYAVFGRVLGTGMTVVDAIYALPSYDLTSINGSFANVPLRSFDFSAGLQLQDFVNVSSISVIPIYPTAGGGAAAVIFSATSGSPGVATVALSGSTLTITPVAPGRSTITISALDVNGSGTTRTFDVTVQTMAPAGIVTQPQSQTVATGATMVFSVEATGWPLTYQWNKAGTPIIGENTSRLVLAAVQAADAGDYTVTVSGPNNSSVTSNPATLTVLASAEPGRIVNLSIRGNSGTGNKVLIMGFVTGGEGTSGTTPLLIRGVGPSIVPAPYNVTDALPDPVIQVIADGATIASNDDWAGDAAVKAAATATGAFTLIGDTSQDAAMVKDLTGHVYSVIVSDKGGAAGSVLAEIYDVVGPQGYNPATPRLVNISARAYVNATSALIAGFVVSGQTAKTVLIRAIGPNPAFATAVGSEALADPQMTLYRAQNGANTAIQSNDNWGGDAQFASVEQRVGADPLTVSTSKDAAILITLDPGVYSAVANGANGSAGIILVEVYDVP